MSKKMKKILVILSLVLVILIAATSMGIAYAGGVRGVGVLGISFFVTAGVIVVLAQIIPAGILLSAMVRSFISSFRKGAMPAHA